MGTPSEMVRYTLKNVCTKFGAFIHRVTIWPFFQVNRPYYNAIPPNLLGRYTPNLWPSPVFQDSIRHLSFFSFLFIIKVEILSFHMMHHSLDLGTIWRSCDHLKLVISEKLKGRKSLKHICNLGMLGVDQTTIERLRPIETPYSCILMYAHAYNRHVQATQCCHVCLL